jgi:hypothetical protein
MARKFGVSSAGAMSWFESLTEREKKFVVGFVAALFIILVGGGFFFVYSKGNERRAEIDAMQKASEEIEKLRPDYASAKTKNEALEAKLLRNNTNLMGVVQAAARSAGLSVTVSTDQALSPKDSVKTIKDRSIREERVAAQVSFANPVSIDRLTSFISAIEGTQGGGVVKIKSMSVRPNVRTLDLLDVTNIVVSTWVSKQGQG